MSAIPPSTKVSGILAPKVLKKRGFDVAGFVLDVEPVDEVE